FIPDIASNPPVPGKKPEKSVSDQLQHDQFFRPTYRPILPAQRHKPRLWTHRGTSSRQMSGVPIQTSSRPFAVPMPSFMSVFDEETNARGIHAYSDHHATAAQSESLKRPASSGTSFQNTSSNHHPFTLFHQHRDSTSTSASESTDSS